MIDRIDLVVNPLPFQADSSYFKLTISKEHVSIYIPRNLLQLGYVEDLSDAHQIPKVESRIKFLLHTCLLRNDFDVKTFL